MSGLVVTPGWYMTLAAVLFALGALGILIRRNALVMITVQTMNYLHAGHHRLAM